MGARYPGRGGVSLRLEPLPDPATGGTLRLSRLSRRSILVAAPTRAAGGTPAGHALLRWVADPGGRRRILPALPLRADQRCPACVRASQHAGDLLHPSVGARSRPAPPPGLLPHADPALHRARADASETPASAR